MSDSNADSPNGKRLVFGGTFTGISGSTWLERDSRKLAQLGKRQVLKVRLLE